MIFFVGAMLYDAGRCDKPCLVVYDIPDNLYEFFFTLSEEVEPQVLQVVIHIYIYTQTLTHVWVLQFFGPKI